MNIFVVIPAYNEEKTIGRLAKELVDKGYNVVVIDDGSKDLTRTEANRYGAEVIVHTRNKGKGECIREGLQHAYDNGCDVVVTMDADGQHNSRELDNFLRAYTIGGADIVIGNRMNNPRHMPFIRRCTNRIMSLFLSLISGREIPDSQCGYRLISRNAIEKMGLRTKNYEIESEIILEASRHNLKTASVEISAIYRGEASQINPFLDTIRFIRFIIYDSFRKRP